MNQKLMKIYNSSDKDKNIMLAYEWDKYFKENRGFRNEDDYDLYLKMKDSCFIIDFNLNRYKIDEEKVIKIVEKLKNNGSIKEKEAIVLLEFAVENARIGLGEIGFNINNSSLDGLADLSQILSLKMFEDIGLRVTKNSASICFNSYFNNEFGTVSFPIEENNNIFLKTYLIDVTYKQFFSITDCNKGKNYILYSKYPVVPKTFPEYYVKNREIAKKLLENGYIELNKDTAKAYGEAFILSTDNTKIQDFDYLNAIMSSKYDYRMRIEDTDELNLSFPKEEKRKSMH